MKTCPTCSREYPDNTKFCAADGATLRAKAASADLVGQVVADRYHIIKKLGEGGMGAVYLGEHVKMGRKSAIKVMMASMANDPDAVARFNREASNAARISHPNVCQIFDFGETSDGLIYLAMEFIEGKSLKDLVESEGAVPAVRSANIIRQSADALQAAHDLGIVHRDIKPDNIMIVQGKGGDDVVKVVDFGIARAVGGDEPGQKVTKTGLVVGTPEYMSPEQLSGDKLDGRSDIYSLGLVFYRMLTGTLPFQADSAQETMIKRLTDDPMPLAEARDDIEFPPKLQLVMNTALARVAAERYQSASEFGRDSMDAVAGMAMPSTRIQPAHEGATHIMSQQELTQATKAQPAGKKPAPRPRKTGPTATPEQAKKGLPFGIIAGAGGGLFAVIAVAALMMNKNKGAIINPDTTTHLVGANTATPPAAPTAMPPAAPPGSSKRPNEVVPQSSHPGPAPTPPPPPSSSASHAASWADTIKAYNDAFDTDELGTARKLARSVFNAPSGAINEQQRASAAIMVATTLAGAANPDSAIAWYRKALEHAATPQQHTIIEQGIRNLGATP
ncbi:MAG TPA: serine/threonine-protein kinase [Gemmatimonadales bacterium]